MRYAIEGVPTSSGICHCRSCRKAASAPSLPFLTVEASRFTLLRGGPVAHHSSPGVARTFCGGCGTPLTYRNDAVPDEIDVMTCSLDDPAAFPPRFHIWTEERPAWARCDEGLPMFPRTREG